MIKKMRYYARFIVVCLLLNNHDDIRHLISELEALVDEYVKTFKPADANEWHMVIEEITTFMDAEKKLIPINADKKPVQVAHRLPAYAKSSKDKQTTPKLRLQEAILVGNYQHQIKFSELTLDMYRMLQSLGVYYLAVWFRAHPCLNFPNHILIASQRKSPHPIALDLPSLQPLHLPTVQTMLTLKRRMLRLVPRFRSWTSRAQ